MQYSFCVRLLIIFFSVEYSFYHSIFLLSYCRVFGITKTGHLQCIGSDILSLGAAVVDVVLSAFVLPCIVLTASQGFT